MVLDRAPGASAVFMVMVASLAADVVVISLFPNITGTQMAGIIVIELLSLVALLFAGRYYYVARDEHDHYVAAEHIAKMLPKEEREALLAQAYAKSFPPRVRAHIEALLQQ